MAIINSPIEIYFPISNEVKSIADTELHKSK